MVIIWTFRSSAVQPQSIFPVRTTFRARSTLQVCHNISIFASTDMPVWSVTALAFMRLGHCGTPLQSKRDRRALLSG